MQLKNLPRDFEPQTCEMLLMSFAASAEPEKSRGWEYLEVCAALSSDVCGGDIKRFGKKALQVLRKSVT